jgi:hypothetical protein
LAPVVSEDELAIVGNISSKMRSVQKSQPNMVPEHDLQQDNELLKNRNRLRIKQVQLVQGAVIKLKDNCVGMVFGKFQGRRALFCTTSSGLYIYDVEFPDFPRLMLQKPMTAGLLGAMPWGGGFIIWGNFGMKASLPIKSLENWSEVCFLTTTVQQVTTNGENLYALTKDRIEIFSRRLGKDRRAGNKWSKTHYDFWPDSSGIQQPRPDDVLIRRSN